MEFTITPSEEKLDVIILVGMMSYWIDETYIKLCSEIPFLIGALYNSRGELLKLSVNSVSLQWK